MYTNLVWLSTDDHQYEVVVTFEAARLHMVTIKIEGEFRELISESRLHMLDEETAFAEASRLANAWVASYNNPDTRLEALASLPVVDNPLGSLYVSKDGSFRVLVQNHKLPDRSGKARFLCDVVSYDSTSSHRVSRTLDTLYESYEEATRHALAYAKDLLHHYEEELAFQKVHNVPASMISF